LWKLSKEAKMAVALEIEDGPPPSYMSPNIQVVSIDDPDKEIAPSAGVPCLLRANVRNIGDEPVQNATVRFYWSNPLVGLDRTTAVLVGSSYISLSAGESATALCLIPWSPVYVNQGHECLFAEAFHPSRDPLPPGPDFNVVADRHVAQRNISVAEAFNGEFHFAFEVANPLPIDRAFEIRSRQADLKILDKMGSFRELFQIPRRQGKLANLAFATAPFPNQHDRERGHDKIEDLHISSGHRKGLTLVGSMEGQAAVVLVEQFANGKLLGGLAVVVVNKIKTAA
jgi:hypothetical protein